MKTKWKVVSPYTGVEEDAPASSAGGGNIAGIGCLLYTSPSPRDRTRSRMPSSA